MDFGNSTSSDANYNGNILQITHECQVRVSCFCLFDLVQQTHEMATVVYLTCS